MKMQLSKVIGVGLVLALISLFLTFQQIVEVSSNTKVTAALMERDQLKLKLAEKEAELQQLQSELEDRTKVREKESKLPDTPAGFSFQNSSISLVAASDTGKSAGDQTPALGTWIVDPKVDADPFFAGGAYPNAHSTEVKNALMIARIVLKQFRIVGFSVYQGSEFIGLLPALYLGFPKSGSTTAYSFMQKNLPCMARGMGKEPHFWYQRFRPQCSSTKGLLRDCNTAQIASLIKQYVRRASRRIPLEKQQKRCDGQLFVVDGSTHTMLELGLTTHRHKRNYNVGGSVPFDYAVLIHALTPAARFVAVVRGTCPDLARSIFWYYRRQQGWGSTVEAYKDLLEKARKAVEHAEQARERGGSQCNSVLHLRNFNNTLRQVFFVSSCHIRRFQRLFGEGSVFMTTVTAMVTCKDNLSAWVSSGGVWGPPTTCTDVKSRNVQKSKTEVEYSTDVVAEEERFLAAIDAASPALIPRPEFPAPCDRYERRLLT